MQKITFITTLSLASFFILAAPAFADTADVTKVQNFIQSIIQVLVTLAGFTAVVFFVIGGFRYITSTGNPENLDGAKKTILYAGIGLAVTIGAFVLTNIVSGLATNAFGK